MAKVTVIDSQTAGISGDMLLGALIDAGADVGAIQRVLDLIPLHYPRCKSVHIEPREVKTHEFRACAIEFKISEDEQVTQARELLQATERIADASGISKRAASFALKSMKVLVDTESRVHGASLSSSHLHEASSADTLADIFGVAVACEELGIFDGAVYSTPVAVGGGTTAFSHGKLSTPPPATLEILRHGRIPIIGGPEPVELATPTGVSMLVNLAANCVSTYPSMVPDIVGYGAGKRELSSAPNLLRVVIGRDTERSLGTDVVKVLETNLDDLPGEILGYTLERVLDAGAKDAWITSAQFKKNRPGHVLHVLCDTRDAARMAEIMMQETGTLGVRYQEWNRFTLQRELKVLKLTIFDKAFDVRVKIARDESGKVLRIKPEFDDIRAISKTLSKPAREISEIVLRETKRIRKGDDGS